MAYAWILIFVKLGRKKIENLCFGSSLRGNGPPKLTGVPMDARMLVRIICANTIN